jgi:hypothetical protein
MLMYILREAAWGGVAELVMRQPKDPKVGNFNLSSSNVKKIFFTLVYDNI